MPTALPTFCTELPIIEPITCEDIQHNWNKLYEMFSYICSEGIDTAVSDCELVGNVLQLIVTNQTTGAECYRVDCDLSALGGGGGMNQVISTTDNLDGTVTVNLTGAPPSSDAIDICGIVATHCNMSLQETGTGTWILTDNAGIPVTFGYQSPSGSIDITGAGPTYNIDVNCQVVHDDIVAAPLNCAGLVP